MFGDTGERSSSLEEVPRVGAWESGQMCRSVRVAHVRTFPTTGLDGFARWWPAVTSVGLVSHHFSSRWVFKKTTSTTLFVLREIPSQIPSNPSEP